VRPGFAGRLYELVFRVFFREFNIAYLDHWPECHEMAYLTPYWLWLVGGVLGDHRINGAYFHCADMPRSLSARLDTQVKPAHLFSAIQLRFLDPLGDFGLMEPLPDQDPHLAMGDVEFRRTPLFRRVLRFGIPLIGRAPYDQPGRMTRRASLRLMR
jgi:hypothetical protein